MELILTGAQTEVLLVHLHVMRKSIKKVLKRNYGLSEGKRLLKLYDRIKDGLKAEIESLTADGTFPFHINKEELAMLHSFLFMFFQKVEEEIKGKVGIKHEQEQVRENMQLVLLEEVQVKVTGLYAIEIGEENVQ
ncbi:hypothetical protein [Niallia sp. 03133]|uniref:hypothetical protein n=1 Tax=Niallia sp. 03133 TaxID=3458060 RepID=UPI004044A35D